MVLWSVEMSESLGFKNSHILTLSGTLVITRSRMFSPRVGVVFSCSKKKLFNHLINEFSVRRLYIITISHLSLGIPGFLFPIPSSSIPFPDFLF